MQRGDVVIMGGGIVGLATAYRITERFPSTSVILIEKETSVGSHQTGHNSGVLHSGIYYKPGSLRALNCREGKLAMENFCRGQEIPFDVCGKVIVAVSESEFPQLDKILERGKQNGVQCEMISQERLREIEPHTAGIKAIHVPEAGIVNYRQVAERLAEIVKQRGGEVILGEQVVGVEHAGDEVIVRTLAREVAGRYAVNCTGLYSDRVAKLGGQKLSAKIVPFRGEYYELKPESEHLCRNLIYPVPDPNFPFLGVHFTRMIQGGVECGPNAVFAFAREGYTKKDINLRDLAESLTYPGFLRLAAKYWRTGLGEMWRSFSKAAFVKALQRLIPEIKEEMLVPGRAGVRAQALAPEGFLIEDFLIQENGRIVNVCNAPSPAATSSLNVGKLVLERLADKLK